MNLEEVLKSCTVIGNVVKLPDVQLDRKIYTEVKKKLELIGGKWKGGKIYGFVFSEDPTELLSQIANGDKRNLKKEFQFFATPSELADRMVELLNIQPTDTVLEPSAGQGALIDAILKDKSFANLHYYEAMPTNLTILKRKYTAENINFLGEDFMEAPENVFYNKIIANPPFSKNQDIDHIIQMYARLQTGGRMVSLISKHYLNSSNKKELEFKEWLSNFEVIDVDAGTFKESGTNIETQILIINN